MRFLFYSFLTVALAFMSCSSRKADDGIIPPPVIPPDTNITVVPEVDNAVQALMTKYDVPGVSVAITKNGKLVYAKGYGYADKASFKKITDSSLFRIASLSKPVTSITIMKLVQEGKLSLDAKVFGEDGILGTAYGSQPYSANITDITIQQLLHHTSGGWQNDGNDPMFTNPDLSAGELISWTLNNRPLSNLPGQHYAYSNFGYSILGRVIEKVTGKKYEEYVRTAILQPAGITDMSVGGNTLAQKKANEVTYYGQNGDDPYVYNITRMDAHGGWIASATDLLRLLVQADGFATVPDILNQASITKMTTGSTANGSYACGWSINNSGNWWHSGSLPGTYTWLTRTSLGYNWAVLTNTRSYINTFGADMDQLIWKAVNNVSTQWPVKDLF